jgi:hypothetical protein
MKQSTGLRRLYQWGIVLLSWWCKLPCPKLKNETWEEYVKRHQKLRNPKPQEKDKPRRMELPTKYES